MYPDTRRASRTPERPFSKQALIFVLSDFVPSSPLCARNGRIVRWRANLAAKTMTAEASFPVSLGFVAF